MKSKLTRKKPTFPTIQSQILRPKLASKNLYKEYFSQESVKVRLAQCELEFEFGRAFIPLGDPSNSKKVKMAEEFMKFFPDWPGQDWKEIEEKQKHNFLLFCYPPPIGKQEEKATPVNPNRPRRAIREEIWIDLCYENTELCEAFASLLGQMRQDSSALARQSRSVGRGATLAQVNDRLAYLQNVRHSLAGPRFQIQPKRLLRSYRETLAQLRDFWRAWRVGHFFTREITYGYGNPAMRAFENPELVEQIDKALLVETKELRLTEAKERAAKYLLSGGV